MEHINYVIRRSLNFAKEVEDINLDMVYTIAYYHDVAHHIDHKRHEVLSAEMLRNDKNLVKWFTEDEIKVMAEAIEDHRASSDNEPRSVYGKIVSSADRNTTLDEPFKRTYAYSLKHNLGLSLDELIRESQEHLQSKFGKNGYAVDKMYFKDLEYMKYLENLNKIIYDDELFRKEFLRINKIKEKEWSKEYGK